MRHFALGVNIVLALVCAGLYLDRPSRVGVVAVLAQVALLIGQLALSIANRSVPRATKRGR